MSELVLRSRLMGSDRDRSRLTASPGVILKSGLTRLPEMSGFPNQSGPKALPQIAASEFHSVGAAVPSDQFDTEMMNSVIGSGEY
jgi:hypothetical protein